MPDNQNHTLPESPSSPPVSRKFPAAWREAAIFGALWGAEEITVGTFLHATRIPLHGICLTAIAVALMVACQMIVSRPWFPLRTALVCAALRSFSPQGIMLGPMFAILLQGLLVSIFFILLRSPLFAGLVSGFIATICAQLQGFVEKLVFYGANFWELFTKLVDKGEDILHISAGNGWLVVLLFLLFIGLIGSTGGFLGWRVGSIALKMREEEHDVLV